MHSQDWFYIAAWPAHLHFKVKARGAIDCSAEQVKYDLQSPLTHWFLVSLLSASWMSLNCERPAKWTKILISFPPLLFSKAPYLPRTELISGKGHRKKKRQKEGSFCVFFKKHMNLVESEALCVFIKKGYLPVWNLWTQAVQLHILLLSGWWWTSGVVS